MDATVSSLPSDPLASRAASTSCFDSSASSSLAPSTPVTTNAYFTPSIVSTTHSHTKRNSFTLLQRIPRDFSSLIRSHSTSIRPRILIPDKEYDSYTQDHMDTDKRKEGRLYSFLHRSRSRSRKDSGRSTSVDVFPQPHSRPTLGNLDSRLPQQPPSDSASHTRPTEDADPGPEFDALSLYAAGPSSKPPALIPSRPLSATTNTTHSTIGPLTPVITRTRSRGRSRYDRYSGSSERRFGYDPQLPQEPFETENESDLTKAAESTSATSSATGHTPTRRRMHTFLGISLPNSRKSISSVMSRPQSPEPQPTPAASRPQTPSRGRRSWIPTKLFPTPRTQPVELPSAATAADAPPLMPLRSVGPESAIKSSIPRPSPVISKRQISSEQSSFSQRSAVSNSPSMRPSDSSQPKSVSHSSSTQKPHTYNTMLPRPSKPTQTTPLSTRKAGLTKDQISRPQIPIPKTISRSPSQSSARVPVEAAAAEHEKLHTSEKRSFEGQRHDRSTSTSSRLGRWSPKLFGRKDAIRDRDEAVADDGQVMPSQSARAAMESRQEKEEKVTKGVDQKIIEDAAKNSATAVRAKHGSFDFEGAAWQSTTTSSRRHAQNRDMPPPPVPAHKQRSLGTPNSSRPLTPHASTGGSSNGQSPSTTYMGMSGKNGAKEAEAEPKPALSRSPSKTKGKTNLVGTATQGHGSFAFEPPVPVRGPASVSDRGQGKRVGKGRSLDLGLGLAWAPNKVKEEALLKPGFARGQVPRASSECREREGKSKIGTEVAETFRGALGEAGFSAFKKYVRQFDAQTIPFDGPTGIVARVERLLAVHAVGLDEKDRRDLMAAFTRVILRNA